MLPKSFKSNPLIIVQGVIFAGFIALSFVVYLKTSSFQGQLDELKDTESTFKQNFEEYLFEDHLFLPLRQATHHLGPTVSRPAPVDCQSHQPQ